MELKFSKKIQFEKSKFNKGGVLKKADLKNGFQKLLLASKDDEKTSKWNYIFIFVLFFGIFAVLLWQLSVLQVEHGEELLAQSEDNQVRVESISALRGVIFDRNGAKLVENVTSANLYVMIDKYIKDGEVDGVSLQITSDTLAGILKDHWKKNSSTGGEYETIFERILDIHDTSPFFTDILIASDLSNDEIIRIKAENLAGVYVDEGSKRSYPYKDIVASILGYTGDVTAEDLENFDYLNSVDVVGRTGIEREYDKILAGIDGQIAWEVDSLGKKISEDGLELSKPVAGKNIYLTLDIELQSKLYETVKKGVSDSDATGGAGIIEDVYTGEILAMVTYPSYDNNLFVGGISIADYSALLNDKANPLLNRAIAAQVPAARHSRQLLLRRHWIRAITR
jgi:penicillin-binding protein 2